MKKLNVFLVLLALVMLSTAADVDVGAYDVGAYNVYYGQLHSHTKISDGKGTPEEAYAYARDVAGLDFFSIADHDYWPNDMTDKDWATIKEAANSFNEDGVYTTFWGFEWTSDAGGWRSYNDGDGLLLYGHMAIINSDDYCIAWWEETNELNELVDWMSTMDCVAFFNHPGQYGFFGTDEPFDFTYSDRIVGMELWNRSTDYYSRTIPYEDPGPFPSSGNRWYDEALQRGFYIGASGSGDNHSKDWGTQNEWRMAILADNLTRTSLLAAMRARRFYSTRDKNLVLSFTCNGAQMGSLIEGAGDLDVVIEASDGDGEIFSQIDLLDKNGVVIQTWLPGITNPHVTTTVSGALDDYFYVIVYQGGGWEAISSPIFIIDPDVTPPTPDPMEWGTVPYAVSSTSIAMIATAATDLFSVEYYFTCTLGGGNDSGWQDSPIYTDTGLTPNMTYTYTVTARDTSVNQNTTAASTGASATTDPAASAPWKFAVVCDSRGSDNGVNTEVLGPIANEIAAAGVDLVIFPGDLVQSGNESTYGTWRDTMAPVYNAGIPVYPVRGNHETYEGTVGWVESFGADIPDNGPSDAINYTYSVEHENALFIGIDHYIGSYGHIPDTWYNDLLDNNTKPHIFVYGHEPAFKVDHTDCLDDDWEERDAFIEDLLVAGGKAYFCGHDHFLDILRADDGDGDDNDDFIQYLVGTGGAPLYNAGPYNGDNSYFTPINIEYSKSYGYTIVEIDGGDVTLTYYDIFGLAVHIMSYSQDPSSDVDDIVITKAEYSERKSELKVEATSTDGGSVTLTVYNGDLTVEYGDMTYKASKDLYEYSGKGVANPGEFVTVTSTGGGEDTIVVTRK